MAAMRVTVAQVESFEDLAVSGQKSQVQLFRALPWLTEHKYLALRRSWRAVRPAECSDGLHVWGAAFQDVYGRSRGRMATSELAHDPSTGAGPDGRYLPVCSCGWEGMPVLLQMSAGSQVRAHLDAVADALLSRP